MRFLCLALLFFCLSGCGYHFPGQAGALPGGVEKLYIPLFVNTTTEPRLENMLTSRVSEVFSRNSRISQVEQAVDAEAILSGTIREYQTRALSYDRSDAVGEYRATMIVDTVLHQSKTKQLLWKGTASWSATYTAAQDKSTQEDLEQQAKDEIVLRLAEEILYQLLDDF